MGLDFEFAEPGTDPTQQKNQIYTHKTWKQAIPWVFMLVALLIGGYMLFLKPSPSPSQSKAESKPTATATTEAVSQDVSKTETVQPTVTVTVAPTESPTETPVGASVQIVGEGEVVLIYDVLLADSKLSCRCNQDDGVVWVMESDEATEACKEHRPEACR